MRSQHWERVFPPLAPVSIYTNCYLCTCILWCAGLYLLTLVLQGWSHLEEPILPIKVEPQLPGALPMLEPVLPVGTTGEGAPGDQPPTAVMSEEVQLAPTPTPPSKYSFTCCWYLALAQDSAKALLAPTLPCKELGLIFSFVHRPTALKHQRGGAAGGRRGGGGGTGGSATSHPGMRSKYPPYIPCYCLSYTNFTLWGGTSP